MIVLYYHATFYSTMVEAQMNYFFLIFLLYFTEPAWSLGIDFHCPNTFQDGENLVTCRINRTAVSEANCLSLSSSVKFERTVYLQTRSVCIINYDPSQPCISEAQHSPGSCWCSKTEGDISTYSFSYLANSTLDQGGQLECKTCILPEKPLNTRVDDNCRNMHFADHQIPSDTKRSNTTTVSKELSKAGHGKVETNESDQPTSPAMIGGIISTVLVLIIIIIIVAALLLLFRNRRRLLSSTKMKGSNMALKEEQLCKMLQTPR